MTREEAIDILKNTIVRFGRTNGKMVYAEALNMAIKALEEPERKKGTWFNCGWSIACSECGYDMPWAVRNYCPNCGARNKDEGR